MTTLVIVLIAMVMRGDVFVNNQKMSAYQKFWYAFIYKKSTMKVLNKFLCLLSGGMFILSGIGKIGNVIYFQHIIVEYGLSYLNILAPFIILAEILIGVLLIFNLKTKIVSVYAICLLLIFTGAFTYAWLANGITDCGCFGNYMPMPSSPLVTYIRNIVLLVLLGIVYFRGTEIQSVENLERVTIYTIMFTATFVAGMTYKPFAFIEHKHPLEQRPISQTNLKDYNQQVANSSLIMFFSYSCPHCINSMENFRAWQSKGTVENTLAYVVVDSTNTNTDSLRMIFTQRYPSLEIHEVNKNSVDFVEAFPTSFVIRNDTIKHVIIGELPSPYLFEN